MSSTSPQHHLPLCVPVLPNGVSPQASKSNQSTQIQWEFIGNWFCSAKTLLIRWTEMINFDPLSAEEVQTPFLTRKGKINFMLTYRRWINGKISLHSGLSEGICKFSEWDKLAFELFN